MKLAQAVSVQMASVPMELVLSPSRWSQSGERVLRDQYCELKASNTKLLSHTETKNPRGPVRPQAQGGPRGNPLPGPNNLPGWLHANGRRRPWANGMVCAKWRATRTNVNPAARQAARRSHNVEHYCHKVVKRKVPQGSNDWVASLIKSRRPNVVSSIARLVSLLQKEAFTCENRSPEWRTNK